MRPFEIYEDKKCTKLVERFEFDRIEVGTNITVEYFIKNNIRDTLCEFKSGFTDPDLSFKFPKEVKAGKVESFTVNWKPRNDRRNILKESANIIAKGMVD